MPLCTEPVISIESLSRALINKRTYLWLGEDTAIEELAKIPWREIWSENQQNSVIDILQDGMNQQYQSGLLPVERRTLPVVYDPDDVLSGLFSHDRFMPVYFLNGLEKPQQIGVEYHQLNSRRKRIIRDRMLEYLSEIRRGVLIISISGNPSSVDIILDDIFSEGFLPDVESIEVIIMAPDDFSAPQAFNKRKQSIYLWQQGAAAFIDKVIEKSKTSRLYGSTHQIRIGKKAFGIDDLLVGSTRRLDDDFHIIEDRNLEKNEPMDKAMFEDFFSGVDPCWPGFAHGLPFERMYKPLEMPELLNRAKGIIKGQGSELVSLSKTEQLIKAALDFTRDDEGKNVTITIPAEAGSGITTLLWKAGFITAQKGYPVLIVKQGVREIDYSALQTFLTELSRRARSRDYDMQGKVPPETPVLIIFDVDHQDIQLSRDLASQLRIDGRTCVVVRAIEPIFEGGSEGAAENLLEKLGLKVKGYEIRCQQLKATVSETEVNSLVDHLQKVVRHNRIDINLPDQEAWTRYQARQSMSYDPTTQASGNRSNSNANHKAESLFWVCLYFFLFKRLSQPDRLAEHLQETMGEIMQQSPVIAEYIYSVAVTTAFRVPLPTQVLARSFAVEEWVEFSETLLQAQNSIPYLASYYGMDNEEYLRFRHPQLAKVLLEGLYRRLLSGTFSTEIFIIPEYKYYPVEWLRHLLFCLEPGNEVHRSFGKIVATRVLKLEGKRRGLSIYANKLIEAFDYYQSNFMEHNQTVLQAYAITLSKSVLPQLQIDADEGRRRYKLAEAEMQQALYLGSHSESEEDHRLLKTTLANIYEAWSRRELDWGDSHKANDLTQQAAALYREVIKDWPESPYARFGYALLLYHQYMALSPEKKNSYWDNLAEALEYLDAKPDYDFEAQWEQQRQNILRLISDERAAQHMEDLIKRGYEIGFIIKARVILGEPEWSDEQMEAAIACLQQAEGCQHPLTNPNTRLSLQYKLITNHSSKKWEYSLRYRLLNRLESNNHYFTTRMLYEYATLSYQLDMQEQGERLFSQIRRGQRYRQLYLEKHEHLYDISNTSDEPQIKILPMKVENIDSYFNGWARVNGIKKLLPYNPTHPWRGQMKVKDQNQCIVRFRASGPQAVPPEFAREGHGDGK